MAIARIASASKQGSGVSMTTDGIDTTGSNLLWIVAVCLWADIASVSDNKSNDWHLLTQYSDGTARVLIAYAYAKQGGGAVTVGSSHTFTATGPGDTRYITIAAGGCSGSGVAGTSDVAGNGASDGNGVTGSVTPVAAGDWILAANCSNNDMTTGITGGPTSIDGVSITSSAVGAAVIVGDLVAANTSAVTATFTSTNLGPSTIARFIASSTAQFARPAADRTDGSWLNSAGTPDNVALYSYIDETSYSDADYIRSSASPSSDTCVIDLSSIGTPQAGTVTLRVRAKHT